MTASSLAARARAAFHRDTAVPPPLTLRGASDLDDYARPRAFDAAIDEPTDAYLEQFAFWGVAYLDAQSWRHYLPRLIDYSLRHPDDPRMVTEALVRSLRPPDRYPPRLGALAGDQEAIVREYLELVAFGHASPSLQTEAQQALEEWWLPNPRARPTPELVAARRAAPTALRDVVEDAYRLSIPATLVGSGVRDIPEESRRVQTWGGDICGDVPTVVAVNVTPTTVRSLEESIVFRTPVFRDPVTPATVPVTGARRAVRLDGWVQDGSPAELPRMIMILAERGDVLVTLSIRTFDRDDVRQAVERIAGSLDVSPREHPGTG